MVVVLGFVLYPSSRLQHVDLHGGISLTLEVLSQAAAQALSISAAVARVRVLRSEKEGVTRVLPAALEAFEPNELQLISGGISLAQSTSER